MRKYPTIIFVIAKIFIRRHQNKNIQKIADIILNEAIDSNFGNIKDYMSIIVLKSITKG